MSGGCAEFSFEVGEMCACATTNREFGLNVLLKFGGKPSPMP